MNAIIALVSLFMSMAGQKFDPPELKSKCVATVFGVPGDRHMGPRTACKPYTFDASVVGIAHRTLPCGKRVLVRLVRTGKFVEAQVVDRGPYGAIMDDGSWALKVSSSDPGRWRGCVDMTPALSKEIGHNGYETVGIWY